MSLLRETLKSKSKYDNKEIVINYFTEIIPISYIHHIKDMVVRTTDKINAANIYDIVTLARNTVVLVTNTKSGINIYPVLRTSYKYTTDFPEVDGVLEVNRDLESNRNDLTEQMHAYYNELASMNPFEESKIFENTPAYLRTGRMKQDSPKLWGGGIEDEISGTIVYPKPTVEIKDNIDDTLDHYCGQPESKDENKAEVDRFGWSLDLPYTWRFREKMKKMQKETLHGPGEILESDGKTAMRKLKIDTTVAIKGRCAFEDASSAINAVEVEIMMCGGNPHITGDNYMGLSLECDSEDMEEIGGIEDND